MKKDIRQTWFLEQPPDIVWSFLTDPVLLAQWLMPNDFKPVKGHSFQFKTRSRMGFDGNIYCTVLEVIPHKRLSYSWKGGPEKGIITLDSVVTWTLTARNGGTELLLEHTGFKGIRNFLPYLIMNAGWGTKIKNRFIQLVNTHSHETT